MSKSSKGVALRHIKEGPIEVLTRVADFNLQEMAGPDGKVATVPATTLVAFRAESFREVEVDSDEWEFTTMQMAAGGQRVKAYIYLSGSDVFMIRALSRVA